MTSDSRNAVKAAAETFWVRVVLESDPLMQLTRFLKDHESNDATPILGIESMFPPRAAMSVSRTPSNIGDYVFKFGGTIVNYSFHLFSNIDVHCVYRQLLARGLTVIQASLVLLCDLLLRLTPSMMRVCASMIQQYFSGDPDTLVDTLFNLRSAMGSSCAPFSLVNAFVLLLRAYNSQDVTAHIAPSERVRSIHEHWDSASPEERESTEWRADFEQRMVDNGWVTDDLTVWSLLTALSGDEWPEALARDRLTRQELRHARNVINMSFEIYEHQEAYSSFCEEHKHAAGSFDLKYAVAALSSDDVMSPETRQVFHTCLSAMTIHLLCALTLQKHNMKHVFTWDDETTETLQPFLRHSNNMPNLGLNITPTARTSELIHLPLMSVRRIDRGLSNKLAMLGIGEQGQFGVLLPYGMPAVLVRPWLPYKDIFSNTERYRFEVPLAIPSWLARAIMPDDLYKDLFGDMSQWISVDEIAERVQDLGESEDLF